MKFRTKPFEIEAEQWTDAENPPAGVAGVIPIEGTHRGYLETIGGAAPVWLGDWVIPEAVPGKHYPCRPDAFAAKYEPVEATTP